MSNVGARRSITRETPQAGASVLLAVRLSDIERRAIGYRLSGRPIDAGNRAVSEVLHRELHRALQDLVMEYRESLTSEQATGVPLVSKDSGVWHVPKDEPERVTNGWRCSIMCDGREDVFDQMDVRAGTSALDGGAPEGDDVGDEERLCLKCTRQIAKGGGL